MSILSKAASTTGATKICGACGKAFTCCAPEECWCGKAEVDRDTLTRLSVTYPDCLCPSCLAEASDTRSTS